MKTILLSKFLLIFTTFSLFLAPYRVVGAAVTDYQLSSRSAMEWSRLLHYRGGSSAISDHGFFLSSQGAHNPESEFVATIDAFRQKDTVMHCRYPARYLWIKEKTGNGFGLSLDSCKNFVQWKSENAAESLSLIYVTGYLGNPASFFGHLLMKLNKSEEENLDIELLDTGINFGADADPDDNPLKYVTYGMFGGYSARYTNANYYLHTASYAENEQRELWEYELNLSDKEVALIQAHLWELQNVKFGYYFLTENCSTAMAHIISIVLDEPILSGSKPWDMPIDIFHALPDIQHNGEPLIKAVKQRESKFTRIQRKYLSLTLEEKRWALLVNQDFEELSHFMSSDLTDYAKAKVLDVLTEYIELLIVTRDDSESDYLEKKRKLLVARLQLESFSVSWSAVKSEPPHEAQLPVNLGIGVGYSDHYGVYTSLRGYAAYYDFLSIDTGRYKDSSITVLDTEIHVTDNEVWLKNIDIINIASLNTNDVALFEDNKLAWQVQLSAEQKECTSSDCYRTYMRGHLGYANKWSSALTFYSMVGPQLDLTKIDDSVIQLPTGALYSWSEKWKMHLLVTPEFNTKTDKGSLNFDLTTRFSTSSRSDVRLSLTKDEDKVFGLYYNRYF